MSVSCTVVPSRDSRRDESASITITAAGEMPRTTDSNISAVSIPVWPSTPGASAATGRRSSNPDTRAISPLICRVANRCFAARGPSASGVMLSLPNPATSTAPDCGSSLQSSADSARRKDDSSILSLSGVGVSNVT